MYCFRGLDGGKAFFEKGGQNCRNDLRLFLDQHMPGVFYGMEITMLKSPCDCAGRCGSNNLVILPGDDANGQRR